MDDASVPVRPLPDLTALNSSFWTSGADGRLRFQRCDVCRYYTHPPGPVCARCLSPAVRFSVVSGRGFVHALTWNHHPWLPGWDLPYCVAIVQLEEQDDLHLLTNIVGTAATTIRIGDEVHVTFERRGDVWLPLFERRVERR